MKKILVVLLAALLCVSCVLPCFARVYTDSNLEAAAILAAGKAYDDKFPNEEGEMDAFRVTSQSEPKTAGGDTYVEVVLRSGNNIEGKGKVKVVTGLLGTEYKADSADFEINTVSTAQGLLGRALEWLAGLFQKLLSLLKSWAAIAAATNSGASNTL